jgi:magnesium transporter
MMFAYVQDGGRLTRLDPAAPIDGAVWVDLYRPLPDQAAQVVALGMTVPTLAEMEEIEISNRLYREAGADYLTVVITGLAPDKEPVLGPVCFILTPDRLVTVRFHAPRPFETYPAHADKSGYGCAVAEQVFLGLVDEIVARQADLMEGVGKSLDAVARTVFGGRGDQAGEVLQQALEQLGREGELLGRLRLGLLTLKRAVSYHAHDSEGAPRSATPKAAIKAALKSQLRDMQALEVHADFLSSRLGLITDATLGMVNLAQNQTVRIVSVVAVLFLPPTLIASVYGMNFVHMPELAKAWGYPVALGLMLASALGTWAFFKWRRWL